jgi:hypothetical protein
MTPRLAQASGPAPLGAQGKQTLQQRASNSSKNEWLVWDEKITVDVYRHAQERASLMVITRHTHARTPLQTPPLLLPVLFVEVLVDPSPRSSGF